MRKDVETSEPHRGWERKMVQSLGKAGWWFLKWLSIELASFPGGSAGKESTYNAGDVRDTGSIPGSEDPLEEDMATHSSILAWRIPWTEEPGGLQSTGSQRVRHDLSN